MEKEELKQRIEAEERKLLNLNSQLDEINQREKEGVLKTKGFKKVLYLLNQEFISSSERTPQYLEFYKVFKKEFTGILKPYTKQIQISKPNHFDVSGFFELKDNRIYWFRIEDLRWDKTFLIRTAKDFKDYTGGSNNYLRLDEQFIEHLLSFLKIN